MPRIQTVDADTFLGKLETATEAELRFATCSLSRTTGWSSGDRTIPDNVLWYLNDGEIEGRLGAREVLVPTDSFHWIASQVPHDLRITGKTAVLRNYVVRFQVWRKSTLLCPPWDRLALPGFERGKFWMNQLCSAAQQPERVRFRIMRSLLICLVAEAIEQSETRVADTAPISFSVRQIDDLLSMLGERWQQQPRPAEMARFFGLSTDYFTRRFRRQFGISPREWLKRQRLKQAAVMLLESSLPIKAIAADLGFADAHFFSRQFGRTYGQTPTAYRRREQS